jgi:uncharacterized membrane protein YfcA
VGGSWLGAHLNGRLDGDVLLLAFSGLVLVAAHRMLFACPTCTNLGEDRALAAAAIGGDPLRGTDAAVPRSALLVGSVEPAALRPSAGGGVTSQLGSDRATRAVGPTPSRPGARWRSPATSLRRTSPDRAVLKVLVAGSVVGLLTGLFGVGGGFVIVPALTLALGLNMSKAIGTSLVIIVGNALVALGFRGIGSVDWGVAVGFSGTMLVGSLVGSAVSHRLPMDKALNAFAGLLVAVAAANAIAAGWSIWG